MKHKQPFPDKHALERRKVRQGFERAARDYDASAVLQEEVSQRLDERLDYIRLQPETVLDMGCGTGLLSRHLQARYPQAQIIGVDLALNMVAHACGKTGTLHGVCADAAALPFRAQSTDLLASNLMLQWCWNIGGVFQQFAQVLKPGGLLMFTTFGPDTLKELRTSWSHADSYTHVSQFLDMHHLGDALLQAGFRDPVMDMEMLTLTYSDVRGLLRDLKGIGANNATHGRNRGLTGKARLQAFFEAYEQFRLDDGKYPASYEVIYGHAWAPAILPAEKPQRYIPITPLKLA